MPSQSPQGERHRYAIVGLGARSALYAKALSETFADRARLAAVCDINEGRLRLAQMRLGRSGHPAVPGYRASDFDRMLTEASIGTVIVTTIDATHHEYICRALRAGADVITEKPMTVDAAKCQEILTCQEETGRKCTVAFNYRYAPVRTQIKQLLTSGVIGDVVSVDFQWLLNTQHGADYFRRWHSQKANSGGLLVHKATHHFDLVNWWLGAMPLRVHARGRRSFYTPAMGAQLGLHSRNDRCRRCAHEDCAFRLDLAGDEKLRELYLENESHDHYFRDRCVFRPDIDIEDTASVLVSYDNDVTLSYSLNAFSPWEGYLIVFNGTRGRLEHRMEQQTYLGGDDRTPGLVKSGGASIRINPRDRAAYEVEPWSGRGSHAGGDELMLKSLFSQEDVPDPHGRAADHLAGACAMLVGVAANRSIVTGEAVDLADLGAKMERPHYAAPPARDLRRQAPGSTDRVALPVAQAPSAAGHDASR
jgi:predicted dehydrogenase